MIVKNNPRIDIDELQRKVEAVVATMEIAEGRPAPELTLKTLPAFVAALPVMPTFGDALHVSELLNSHDEAFVINVYRALLRREPEPDVSNNILLGLRSGQLGRLDVIYAVYRSPEARAIGVKVSGLRGGLVGGLRNARGLGRLLRIFTAVGRLPSYIRAIEAAEAQAHNHLRGLERRLEAAWAALRNVAADNFATLVNRVESLAGSMAQQRLETEAQAKALDDVRRDFSLEIKQLRMEIAAGHSKLEAALAQQAADLNADFQARLKQQADATEAGLGGINAALGNIDTALEDLRTASKHQSGQFSDELARAKTSFELLLKQIGRTVAEEVDLTKANAAKASEALAELRGEIARCGEVSAQLERRLQAAEVSGGERNLHLQDGLDAVGGELTRLQAEIVQIGTVAERTGTQLAQLEQQVDAAQVRVGKTETVLQDGQKQFDQRIGVAIKAATALSEQVAAQGGAIDRLMRQSDDLRQAIRMAAEHGQDTSDAADAAFFDFYNQFENRFRGSREEISKRFEAHLPYAGKAYKELRKSWRAVDLGCGRGEWLELSAKHKIPTTGVDSNAVAVNLCRELGLEVEQADLITWLEQQGAESLSMITAFHVAEHMTQKQLLRFLDLCRIKLRPGGLLMLETPNPNNLFVGATTFHTDLTHVKPLVPAVLQYALEYCGFGKVLVLPLFRAAPLDLSQYNPPLSQILERGFNQSEDYAAVAWKAS